MNAPDTALQRQDMAVISQLYMAFELGEKSWKLSLDDGVRGPSRHTLAAGDKEAVLQVISKAKARFGLAPQVPAAVAMRPAVMASAPLAHGARYP